MKVVDRVICGSLAIGVWVVIVMHVVSSGPSLAQSVTADDIDGLRSYIERTVEDCQVSGKVGIDNSYSGHILYGEIRC